MTPILSRPRCVNTVMIREISSAIFNSLTSGGCGGNFKRVIFEHMLWTKSMCTCCGIILRWTRKNTFDERSLSVAFANIDLDLCRHMASLSAIG